MCRAIMLLQPLFEGFSFPAIDQIVNHASRIRNRTRGRFSCPLVVRFPYCGGIRALEHHSDSPEAYYVHTPGLKVVIPSNPYDAKGLLISSIRDNDPVIFMEPKRLYRAVKQEVPEKEYTLELGKANLIKEGNEITLISYGAMVRECVNASEQAKVSCDIIDLRTLKPLDTSLILDSVKKTGRVVIVHEAQRICGVGAEIAALIQEKVLLSLKAPVKRVTGFDIVFPYFKLENDYLLSEIYKLIVRTWYNKNIKIRNYKTPLQAYNYSHPLPDKSVETLLEVIKKNN